MVATTDPGAPAQGDARARAWLSREAGACRGWIAGAVAAGLVATAALIVQAGLLARVVHAALVEDVAPAALVPWLAGAAAAAVARAGGDWGRRACGIAAGVRLRRSVRRRVLDHAARLGPLALADLRAGALAGRALEQVDALDGYVAGFRPQLALALLAPLAIGATALWLDWVAGLLLFLAAPLIPLFMALVGMGAERLGRRQYEVMNRLAGHFLDRVRGLATLQLFGATGRATAEVAEVSEQYRERSMRTLRVAFLSSAVLELFSAMAIATVAIYVGFGLLGYIGFGPADELTLFAGLFVLLLAPEFFQPLRTLAQHYHDRAAAVGAAGSLLELLERPLPEPAPTRAGDAALDLAGVCVRYPGTGPVLDGFDLQVAAGEAVALVGPTGSGKSTVLAVAAGLLAPDAGSVTVAGGPAGTPGGIAWVGQRPFLAQASVADNIALGRPGADAAAIRDAAARAGVGEFVERLPAGLDTLLGERGHGLSGGEAQRVALARAFLSRAPLVLLDEPTRGLDARAEARVLAALRRLVEEGRTIVAATHHGAVAALMDRVVELPGAVARA